MLARCLGRGNGYSDWEAEIMATITVNIPDEVAEFLRKRVTWEVTVTDQVNAALRAWIDAQKAKQA